MKNELKIYEVKQNHLVAGLLTSCDPTPLLPIQEASPKNPRKDQEEKTVTPLYRKQVPVQISVNGKKQAVIRLAIPSYSLS